MLWRRTDRNPRSRFTVSCKKYAEIYGSNVCRDRCFLVLSCRIHLDPLEIPRFSQGLRARQQPPETAFRVCRKIGGEPTVFVLPSPVHPHQFPRLFMRIWPDAQRLGPTGRYDAPDDVGFCFDSRLARDAEYVLFFTNFPFVVFVLTFGFRNRGPGDRNPSFFCRARTRPLGILWKNSTPSKAPLLSSA